MPGFSASPGVLGSPLWPPQPRNISAVEGRETGCVAAVLGLLSLILSSPFWRATLNFKKTVRSYVPLTNGTPNDAESSHLISGQAWLAARHHGGHDLPRGKPRDPERH